MLIGNTDMDGHTPAALISACLETEKVTSMLDKFAASLEFRRYRKASTRHDLDVAEGAVTKFLMTGSDLFVTAHIESEMDLAEGLSELASVIEGSEFYRALAAATAETVHEAFPDHPAGQIKSLAGDEISRRAIEMARRLDPSRPTDVLREAEFVFCYAPGLDDAETLEETMTSHWGEESSVATIKPDHVFARFLQLAGVTKDQWIEAVRTEYGIDLLQPADQQSPAWIAERAAAWAVFAAPLFPDQRPVASLSEIMEAVDNIPGGFTPSVAFLASADQMISRDWTRPLAVRGGVLGLSDLIRGTGDPVRFEGVSVVTGAREDIVLSTNMPNPLEKIYGMHASAFRSRVRTVKSAFRVAAEQEQDEVRKERSVG